MRTVHIGVAGWDDLKRNAQAAFRGEYQGEHIGFVSLELMHRTLTPNRWRMLQAMMGHEAMGIRELARKLDRDVKQVHTDAAALVTGWRDQSNRGWVGRISLRRCACRFHRQSGMIDCYLARASMSKKAFDRISAGLNEALEIAKDNARPTRLYIDGRWHDLDDAPLITKAMLDRAEVRDGDKAIRRSRRTRK